MSGKSDSFLDLIHQAREMLLDRSKPEQDLIYYISKLEPELRSAIVIAYQNLYEK